MKKILSWFLAIALLSTSAHSAFRPPQGGGGGGTPGAPLFSFQWNNAGSFAGDTGFLTNGAGLLDLDGELQLTDDSFIRFGSGSDFNLEFDTSGVRQTLTLTKQTQTGLSLAAQVPSILFDLSPSKTFVAGNGLIHGEFSILAPTLNGTAPGTSFFGICTVCLEGAPKTGTDIETQVAFGFIIGNLIGSTNGWNTSASAGFLIEGIDDGVGTVDQRSGIIVSGVPSGDPVSLGNQTALLSSFIGIKVEGIEYESDTNVRTIERASGIDVSPPIEGANTNTLEGPYAIFATGQSRFNVISHIEDSDLASSNLDWDSNIIQINAGGGGTIDTITPPQDNLPTILTIIFQATVTMDNENGATGEMRLAGNVDGSFDANDVLTLVWKTNKWFEVSRSIN